MSRAMMFFVPTILVVPIVTILSTAQTSFAEPAADECKTVPGSSAPAGSHWYYRINRADQRRCWFLGPENMKARSQAREGQSYVSSPTRTPRRENAVETAREKPVPEIPVPVEQAQKTSLEVVSAESNSAGQISPRLWPISQKHLIWTRASPEQTITMRRCVSGRTRRRKCLRPSPPKPRVLDWRTP